MKVLYEAIDGYSEVVEYSKTDLLKELKYHEVGLYQAVSFDGVSKLIPHDMEAETFFSKVFQEQF
jgi:hypothetical protein